MPRVKNPHPRRNEDHTEIKEKEKKQRKKRQLHKRQLRENERRTFPHPLVRCEEVYPHKYDDDDDDYVSLHELYVEPNIPPQFQDQTPPQTQPTLESWDYDMMAVKDADGTTKTPKEILTKLVKEGLKTTR